MFCERCGVANPDNGSFCVGCGAPLRTQAAPATPMGLVTGAPPVSASPPEKSGRAIASLICGLLFFVFPAAVAAIILGHLALSEIRKGAGRLTGRGMAITGLVLGYIGIALIPVVVVLLIAAAIAVPSLLRASMAANEASAVSSLRTISAAANDYSRTYSNGFPTFLEEIGVGPSATCEHARLIDWELEAGEKNGYKFTYVPRFDPGTEVGAYDVSPQAAAKGCKLRGAPSFEVHADPITRGRTGRRSFFIDVTGVIRVEKDGPATTDSPPLE